MSWLTSMSNSLIFECLPPPPRIHTILTTTFQLSMLWNGFKTSYFSWLTLGGTHIRKGYGMCCGHDPLFSGQSSLPSLSIYSRWAALVTPFSILRIFFFYIFRHVLAKILVLYTQIFPNSRCQEWPAIFKENPLPRPYILKPAWHTSTQKKEVECPPGGGWPCSSWPIWIYTVVKYELLYWKLYETILHSRPYSVSQK